METRHSGTAQVFSSLLDSSILDVYFRSPNFAGSMADHLAGSMAISTSTFLPISFWTIFYRQEPKFDGIFRLTQARRVSSTDFTGRSWTTDFADNIKLLITSLLSRSTSSLRGFNGSFWLQERPRSN